MPYGTARSIRLVSSTARQGPQRRLGLPGIGDIVQHDRHPPAGRPRPQRFAIEIRATAQT
ncbi:hypothetical protein ABGB18_02255 [Nonomuraea sp. B12E4]|uniref:hypothetical protein n=1 Tax=Nonomuraea sp. B12E4 TaxID=3153564 RepID=UPI00325CA44F